MIPVFGQGIGMGATVSGNSGPYQGDAPSNSDYVPYLKAQEMNAGAFVFLGGAFKVGIEGGMYELPVLVGSLHGEHFGLAAWGGKWSVDTVGLRRVFDGRVSLEGVGGGAALLQSWTFGSPSFSENWQNLSNRNRSLDPYQTPRFSVYEYFAQNQVSYLLSSTEALGPVFPTQVGYKTVHEAGMGIAVSALNVGAELTCGRILEARQFRVSFGVTFQVQKPLDWKIFQRAGG